MREFKDVDAVGENADDIDSALGETDCHLADVRLVSLAGVSSFADSDIVQEGGVRWRELLDVVVPQLGVLGQKVRIFVWSTQAQRFSPGCVESRFPLLCRIRSCNRATRNRYEA